MKKKQAITHVEESDVIKRDLLIKKIYIGETIYSNEFFCITVSEERKLEDIEYTVDIPMFIFSQKLIKDIRKFKVGEYISFIAEKKCHKGEKNYRLIKLIRQKK